jgi:hypothetical protein
MVLRSGDGQNLFSRRFFSTENILMFDCAARIVRERVAVRMMLSNLFLCPPATRHFYFRSGEKGYEYFMKHSSVVSDTPVLLDFY